MAPPPKHFPPVQFLNECFMYDPETGLFTWRHRPLHHFDSLALQAYWNRRWAGKPAFKRNCDGYRVGRVSFDRENFHMRAHRVAFAMMTGRHPQNEIDHIDRNRKNNKWDNLREATSVENSWNMTRKAGALPVGVRRVRTTGFCAVIQSNGVLEYLGTFKTVAEAAEARKKAERETRGYFTEAAQ